MNLRKTRRNAFPDGFGEWFYELRTGLRRTRFDREHGTPWRVRVRYTLRMAACGAGLHWPVQSTQGTFGGYVMPDDPHFECACCGHVRDPYRAIFWEGGRLHSCSPRTGGCAIRTSGVKSEAAAV